MPIGRASETTPSGTKRPKSGSGGTRVGRSAAGRRIGNNPWSPIIEASQMVAARFADPVMMEGVNALDFAGDAVDALADAFTKVGQMSAEQVAFDPRVLPYFEELGRYVRAAAQPTRDGAAAVRIAHADDIRRIEEGDARERRKDVSAHDG